MPRCKKNPADDAPPITPPYIPSMEQTGERGFLGDPVPSSADGVIEEYLADKVRRGHLDVEDIEYERPWLANRLRDEGY